MSEPEQPQQESFVTLRFNRKLTQDEIESLKSTVDAIEVLAGDGHHDHDHPTIVEMPPRERLA